MARWERAPHMGYIIVALGAFCVGIFGQVIWAQHFASAGAFVQTDKALRETGKYKLTAPLLTCASYENTALNESSPLRADTEKLIQAKIKSGEASDISVYFRGFSGQWMGVNENDTYSPASLLKVPLMIAYYKEAEADPNILDKTLVYDGSTDANASETFRSLGDLTPGRYTIGDLIKAMIVYSDNNATALLTNNIDPEVLSNVYTDLGLSVPPSNSPQVSVISAKQYAYFFRVLYNATYLTSEYSEKALELLSSPGAFPQGIQATVPGGTTVADKFGERTLLTQQMQVISRELHDCGLVYMKADKPYLLCIMTRGKNFDTLIDVIQSISKLVYSEASKASN